MTDQDTATRTRFATALRAAGAFLRTVFEIRDVVGLAGAGFVAYGAGEIYRPAGFITLGGLLLLGVFLSARAPRA